VQLERGAARRIIDANLAGVDGALQGGAAEGGQALGEEYVEPAARCLGGDGE
jgi:hypothetical protein